MHPYMIFIYIYIYHTYAFTFTYILNDWLVVNVGNLVSNEPPYERDYHLGIDLQ